MLKLAQVFLRIHYLTQRIFNAKGYQCGDATEAISNALIFGFGECYFWHAKTDTRDHSIRVWMFLEAGNLDKVERYLLYLCLYLWTILETARALKHRELATMRLWREWWQTQVTPAFQISRPWRHSMLCRCEVFSEVLLLAGNWWYKANPTCYFDSDYYVLTFPILFDNWRKDRDFRDLIFGMDNGVEKACARQLGPKTARLASPPQILCGQWQQNNQ